ncbi:MAG: PEP-CTERM sorting domain-containing protein [bacterium]|nr:PEP-CTERM sorting domain-containing protein [bacterium]
MRLKVGVIGVVLALMPGLAFGADIFTEDFNTPLGPGWTVNADADTAHTFAWDYSTMGIPAAPGGADTLGLKMEANLSASLGAGVTATPTGLILPDYSQIKFDMWINMNGPMPGGGTGSTEFMGGGIGYDGTTVIRPSASGVGGHMLCDGDGGSSRDYRMYKTTSEQFVASGQYSVDTNNNSGVDLSAYFAGQPAPAFQVANYPQQTGTAAAGTLAFGWHEVIITKVVFEGHAEVRFVIDGLRIGTLDNTIGSGFDYDGGMQLTYTDMFSSVSDNAALSFGVIDNLVVTDVPEPASLALLAMGGLAMLRRRR